MYMHARACKALHCNSVQGAQPVLKSSFVYFICSVSVKLCFELPQAWNAGEIPGYTTGEYRVWCRSHCACKSVLSSFLFQVTAEVADGSKVFHLLGSHG